MDYLEMLGLDKISGGEAGLARLLISQDGPADYNPDLNLHNYLHFLRVFSKNDSASEANYNLIDRQGHDLGWKESYKIERMLTILFSPVEDITKIRERQDLLRRYISSKSGEEERDLAELTYELTRNHYSLYSTIREDVDRIDLNQIAPPFVKTIASLVRFRDRFHLDPKLKYFAQRIDEIFKRNPITKLGVLLEQGGAVIVGTNGIANTADKKSKIEKRLEKERDERRNSYGYISKEDDGSRTDGYEFWLARSEPVGKGIFDLGKFHISELAKMRDYPNQKRDIVQMIHFANDSAVLVYTLASILYQADIYNRRKRLGLPVCIPDVNDEGRFRVKNGHPIATHLKQEPVAINVYYDRGHRKFLAGGAHSGGKSELITNVGLYTVVGVGGGIWPAEEGEVPVTRKVFTSMRKRNEQNKGSLESELKNAMQIAREMGPRDLALIDEFLDTTKPELARHISYPLLAGEKDLCIGFAKSPGTVFIVDHRAPSLDETIGFKFIHPVLERRKASDLAAEIKKRLRYASEENEDLDFFTSLGDSSVLVPTHTFAVGKPNPADVREHALQMWKRVLWEVSHAKDRDFRARRDYEPYSTDEDDHFRKEDPLQKGNYVTWQVPGRVGGIWMNDTDANTVNKRNYPEYQDDESGSENSRWRHDEIVTEKLPSLDDTPDEAQIERTKQRTFEDDDWESPDGDYEDEEEDSERDLDEESQREYNDHRDDIPF